MALPINDPSVFLPTPFAPGENANSLQDEPAAAYEPTAASAVPIAPYPAFSGGIPGGGAMPPGMPSFHQQQLLQQLAAAYSVGGQSMFPPAAVMGGRGIPASLMAGLVPPRNNHNYHLPGMPGSLPPGFGRLPASLNPALSGMAGLPASLNPALAGMPASLNPALAGMPASFNPALAGMPASLNPALAGMPASLNPALAGMPASLNPTIGPGVTSIPGLSGLGLVGTMGNFAAQQSALGNSSSASSTANQSSMINAMSSFPPQSTLAQQQLDRLNATKPERALSSEIGKMPALNAAPLQQNAKTAKKKSSSSLAGGGSGNDPLIKSREARWIIRYNELLEVSNVHFYFFTLPSFLH